MSDTITLGEYVTGERPIPLVYTFTDSANAPISLVGYTAKFLWCERDGVAADASAVITNPAAGEVTYTWSGTEFAGSPGSYWAEFWVGNGLQRFASWKIIFTVRASIGPVPNI